MAALTFDQIREKLAEKLGAATGPTVAAKDPFVVVPADKLVAVCRCLRDEPDLAFDFLQDETATDHPKENLIRVVYHFWSYPHRHGFKLKVELDRANPRVPTVEQVWQAANWLEREVYDLFGVHFEGHSDLRRIMLADSWDKRPLASAHPLRKDYQELPEVDGISVFRQNPLDLYKSMDDKVRASQASAAPAPAAPANGEKV